MWRDSAILVRHGENIDSAGDTIETPEVVETKVFCNILSIGQSEFYQAMATGFKPELKLEIYEAEYSGEKTIKVNNKTYDVIRTFRTKNSDILEITLGSDINGIA